MAKVTIINKISGFFLTICILYRILAKYKNVSVTAIWYKTNKDVIIII